MKNKNTNGEAVSRKRHKIMGFALMGIMAAGVVVGSVVTDRIAKTIPPRKRAVLQCKYDVRGKTITKNIELTPEEARHIKVKGSCQVKKCSMGLNPRTRKTKFYDCKPLDEKNM